MTTSATPEPDIRSLLDRISNWSGQKVGFFVCFRFIIFLFYFTEEIMARPYSVDLRERVLQFYDDGYPVEDVAQHFSVSESWVYSLLKQRRETGNIVPKVRPTTYNTKLMPHEQEVRNSIAEHVDATLSERCEMLEKHVSVSRSTLCRFLKRLKITFKKNSLRCRTTS